MAIFMIINYETLWKILIYRPIFLLIQIKSSGNSPERAKYIN